MCLHFLIKTRAIYHHEFVLQFCVNLLVGPELNYTYDAESDDQMLNFHYNLKFSTLSNVPRIPEFKTTSLLE